MKNLVSTVAVLLFMLLSACNSTWDSESKAIYLQACDEEAQEWNKDATARKNYCDCALQKTMNRYPKFADAMANTLDDTVLIQQILSCRYANQ